MASVTSPENSSKEVGGLSVEPDAEQTTPDSPPPPDQSDNPPSPPPPEQSDNPPSPPAPDQPPSPPAPDQSTPTTPNESPLPPVPEAGSANTPAPKSSPTSTPTNSPPPKGSSTRPLPEPKNTGQDSKNSPNAVADGPPVVSSRKSPSQQSSPSVGGRSSTSDNGGAEKTAFIVGAVVASVLVLLLLAICLCCCFRKKKRKHHYYMDSPRHGAQGHHQGPHQGHPQGEYYSGPPNWSGLQSSGQQMNQHMPPPNTGGWTSGSGEYHSGYLGHQHMSSHSGGAISPNVNFGSNKFNFTYEELAIATGGFSQGNLLGQGGFGYVHKGVFPDGKEVAVKSLKVGSGQGEREFQAEVEIISRVHHRHLVSLVGYCIADSQRMLVYEFVPNGTMEHHLHGKGQPVMDWGSRMKIALGSAKGLAYLHEDCHPRIIHRDIKAANILLDNNFEAMVADFGLAKLSTDNHTHVSTRVMGTFGYLAPEYASSGKLSEKSDVFSFGVMLLELITGKRPVDPTDKYMEDSLVDWARPLLTRALEEGIFDDLVDPRLENNFPPVEMTRMIGCAAASIRHSARRRPRMSQIVRALEGDSLLEDLKDGPKPGASVADTTPAETSIYDTCAYNADIMKFRKMVMSQDDCASSQFSETTSEYGHNTSSSSGDSRDLSLSSNQGPNKM